MLQRVAHLTTRHATALPAYTLNVIGNPAPQGSKRFVGLSRTGKGVLVEAAKGHKAWRECVTLAAREYVWQLIQQHHLAHLECPVSARMVFTLPRPTSRGPHRSRAYPSVRPDVSKLVRSVEDSLVVSGLLHDDSLIVEYTRIAKVYPNTDPEAMSHSGVRLVLTPLNPTHPPARLTKAHERPNTAV